MLWVNASLSQESTFRMADPPHRVKSRDYSEPDSDPQKVCWRDVSSEFLRALRAGRSQEAFSRRLGYRSKPAADWEAGRRFPRAAEVFRACGLCNVDMGSALATFLGSDSSLPQLSDPQALAAWLDTLRGSTTILELAERSQLPRFSVSRFLKGESQPRLPQFFALFDAITQRATDLVAGLVDIGRVPSLHKEHQRREVSRLLAYHEPWTAAVERVLETEAYAALACHVRGWITEYLGVSLDEEERALDALEEAGVVRFVDGKYRIEAHSVDTRRTRDESLAIKSHWNHVAGSKLLDGAADDLFAYNLISVSTRDLERIDDILRGAFREIRGLVSESEPLEEVALVQVQLTRWRVPRQ